MATSLGNGVKNIIQSGKDGLEKNIVSQKEKATNTIKQNIDISQFVVGGGFGGAIGEKLNSQTKTTASSATMQRSIESPLPAERLSKDIFGNDKNYISTLVNEMLDATVNKKIRDEIRKGTLSVKTSQLGKTYATAVAYYKKLYDGSIIMTELRNKTEKNISKLINQRLNDKVKAWQDKLPKWQKMLLAKSKLMSSLTNNVNEEVRKYIRTIMSDSAIKTINDSVIGNLKKIRDSINTTFTTQFKKQIESVVKLRNAIQEKIKVFMEVKRQYEQKIMDAINKFKEQIANVIQDFTQQLVSSLVNTIKIDTGAIKF